MKDSTIRTIRLGFLFVLAGIICIGLWLQFGILTAQRTLLDAQWQSVFELYSEREAATIAFEDTLSTASIPPDLRASLEDAEARGKIAITHIDRHTALNAYQRSLELLARELRKPSYQTVQGVEDFQEWFSVAEDVLSPARRAYNAEARKFNLLLNSFPYNVLKYIYGFEQAPLFRD